MTWQWYTLGALVLAAGAAAPVLFQHNRRTAGGKEAISARARAALLGHYVEDPVVTADPEAVRLLRAGRERWNSAGAVLATANSVQDYNLAKQIADEGLAAVRAAHARIGLPGPGS
ncbi:hypothetical protein SAMN05216266_114201 [Amycolatopsis marina]|uniref:Uncharacterized protein n=1 Tax=Amycolatopsis marina TaxID=490629 RepID=A0A1I1BP81_9PSEU|nr:hypothetical protein [Amycolatopsis marina]SFB50548.1 hypothetical protein SAMN05216266_114201 [Amycolatopsis marina]